jgi:aspartate/tyrosine/aromatic aminotransferase
MGGRKLFAELPTPPQDPILGLAQRFEQDPSDTKVDLGIGVYKDERGEVPILRSVKQAEAWLTAHQRSKSYLSSIGNPNFNRLVGELVLGAGSDALRRSQTIQTPGGTGGLRVAADLLHKLRPRTRIFIPSPTWANHQPLFAAAGHEVVPYAYYDVRRGELQFDAMLAALANMTAEDVLLLHGCCQNPTGADLDSAQWQAIAELLARTGAMPLVDLAYQGFAVGLREDSSAVTLLASRLPELFVASSYSKNFALYRDRVGALTLIGAREVDAVTARAHALIAARTNYSMPPDHGAAVVACILGSDSLRGEWEQELRAMRERIKAMRAQLVAQLEAGGARDLRFLAHQHGMFALLGLSPQAVETLRVRHHVYVTGSGRINVAGLTPDNVGRVAAAIAAVRAG